MTALLLAVLAWAPPQGRSPAPEPDRIVRAEQAYQAGRYAEASELYQAALKATDGTVQAAPGPILFNLGNCAYRMERYAEAVWFYRRAARHGKADHETRFNLRLAQRRLGVEPPETESFGAALDELIESMPPGLFPVIVWVLQTAGLLGLVAARRHRVVRGVTGVIVLLALLGAARLVHDTCIPAPLEAVVLRPGLAAHAEPHPQTPVTLELSAGATVGIVEMSERWARIENTRGSGWTPRRGLGLVE